MPSETVPTRAPAARGSFGRPAVPGRSPRLARSSPGSATFADGPPGDAYARRHRPLVLQPTREPRRDALRYRRAPHEHRRSPARAVPVTAHPADGWELRGVGGLDLLVCAPLEAVGVDAAVTGRRGGLSQGSYRSLNLGLHVGDDPAAVRENRRRAARAFGTRLEDLVLAVQVHGATAVAVTQADRGRGSEVMDDAVGEADVLVTDRPGPVLVTLAADCAPVVLVDPAAGVLATAHAGWRGVAAGVVTSALDAMGSFGARPERVVAGIGPTVSARTYQVGDEVAAAVRRALGPADHEDHVLVPDGPGHWLLDLPTTVRLLLHRAGVPPEAVHAAAATTGAGGPFFSDREVRPCGRFGLLSRLRR